MPAEIATALDTPLKMLNCPSPQHLAVPFANSARMGGGRRDRDRVRQASHDECVRSWCWPVGPAAGSVPGRRVRGRAPLRLLAPSWCRLGDLSESGRYIGCGPFIAAQDRWRAINGPHLVALVRAGATFKKELLVENPDQVAA